MLVLGCWVLTGCWRGALGSRRGVRILVGVLGCLGIGGMLVW